MATRAELFRAKAEQKNARPKHSKKTPKHFPGEVRTENGPVKKRGVGHTATRNVSRHAAKKATYALEDSATKPSRKSTRKSANRIKFEAPLHRRSIVEARTPETRAAKSNVWKKRHGATVPKRRSK
jgi:hypothetical protein